MARRAVIDASAAIELLLGRLPVGARQSIAPLRLSAPAHLDAEVLNVMRRLVRREELSESRARLALRRLATRAIRREPIAGLTLDAWRARDNLTGYDALYVALARRLECPLVTADARIASAPDLGVTLTVLPTPH